MVVGHVDRGEVQLFERVLLHFFNLIMRNIDRIGEPQSVEHLIVNFLYLISSEVNSADPSFNCLKSLSSNLVDLIIFKVEPPQKSHSSETVCIQFCYIVLGQVENRCNKQSQTTEICGILREMQSLLVVSR